MNYVPMSLGMFIIHRLSAADQYRVCGIVVVSQIHHIYMTCNLQSNPERDKRGNGRYVNMVYSKNILNSNIYAELIL